MKQPNWRLHINTLCFVFLLVVVLMGGCTNTENQELPVFTGGSWYVIQPPPEMPAGTKCFAYYVNGVSVSPWCLAPAPADPRVEAILPWIETASRTAR